MAGRRYALLVELAVLQSQAVLDSLLYSPASFVTINPSRFPKGVLFLRIDRLIGILSTLLQHGKVTAPYLAEKFEVSRRTISRDIDTLCQAGIPVMTEQGANGGISIMEHYRIDPASLSRPELHAILAGLKGLDSISSTNRYQKLMEKLSGPHTAVTSEHILIDLSSYYKKTLSPKIEALQSAIREHHPVEFDYLGPNGESHRRVEPYLLVFQWSSWYLRAFCLKRGAERLFKLNRLLNLQILNECFVPRLLPPYQIEPEAAFPHLVEAKIRFSPAAKWRLVDEYGAESFSVGPDGMLLFQSGFTDREQLFSWLLSFSTQAELLEPAPLRSEFQGRIKKTLAIYSET